MVMADIRIQDAGTIVLIVPESDQGEEWLREHLPADAPRFGGAWAAEPRYVPPIIDGAQADGLYVA